MRNQRPTRGRTNRCNLYISGFAALIAFSYVWYVVFHRGTFTPVTDSSADPSDASKGLRNGTAAAVSHRDHPASKEMRKVVVPGVDALPVVEPLHIASRREATRPSPGNKGGSGTTARVAQVTWSEFVASPFTESVPHGHSGAQGPPLPLFEPVLCADQVVQRLAAPRLSTADFEWCKWATRPDGGNVVVGKSWGKLGKKQEHRRFDTLNCNAVGSSGANPSCDASWGALHIKNWRSNPLPEYSCGAGSQSRVSCFANDNADKICTIDNAQIDFARAQKKQRSPTPSKTFQAGFLSSDCKGNGDKAPVGFPFSHLYSPSPSRDRCDYVHNGTLLLFSHDDIRNLAHTLNDIFNVWVMLWMEGVGRGARSLNMLNVDSFKLGHNFDDQPNAFFHHYTTSMQHILKGADFQDKTLCVQRLLVQPVPPRFFIWESWFAELPCSFVGPSSLYQRWNVHIRRSSGLLQHTPERRMQVLLVVRNENFNPWGNSRTSRNYLNLEQMNSTLAARLGSMEVDLVTADLGKLSFPQQLQLIAQSSIMIGMHGAGMASSMHMSIG
ncbi:hypothetical protein B484DRAFT_458801, partial [Ochromonadaceae sp. CCMP2298]